MKKIHLFFLVLISLFSFSALAAGKNCQENRMGFDIGSGSTKMMVAKVDTCKKIILEVLHSESHPVAYNEDLEKNSDGRLSSGILKKGSVVLAEMKKNGLTFKPQKTYGVATSVFRKAKNGGQVIKEFSRTHKIKLDVISQEDEALLGYLSVKAASAAIEQGPKNLVVWDIGGGSMQMYSYDQRGNVQRYLGNLASVSFKNMVIEALELKNIETTLSPNPIGDKREQAIALARSYARLHVPAELRFDMVDRVVVGVGGVHSQSIKNQLQLKEMHYTLEDLQAASKLQSLKSDHELTGEYRSTDVTNLLLVQGFMEALGIKEVKIVNASILQGVVLR